MHFFITEKEIIDFSSVIRAKLEGETLTLSTINKDLVYSGAVAIRIFSQYKAYAKSENKAETQAKELMERDHSNSGGDGDLGPDGFGLSGEEY